MPANTSPIFSVTGKVSWGTNALVTANTAKDGTGTVLGVFTGGTNGSFVQRIRFKASGSTSNAAVVRVFINNGSSNSVAANNILFDEITIPITTTTAEAAATAVYELPLNFALPAGYVINVTIGVTQTSGGVYVSVIGGDY
jgi:hypothetical protein